MLFADLTNEPVENVNELYNLAMQLDPDHIGMESSEDVYITVEGTLVDFMPIGYGEEVSPSTIKTILRQRLRGSYV